MSFLLVNLMFYMLFFPLLFTCFCLYYYYYYRLVNIRARTRLVMFVVMKKINFFMHFCSFCLIKLIWLILNFLFWTRFLKACWRSMALRESVIPQLQRFLISSSTDKAFLNKKTFLLDLFFALDYL